MRIVLYGYWRSSSSYRVRLALAYKGIAHENVFVNLLKGEQRTETYAAQSPTGYIPCLEVDGQRFIESVAILELLDELVPNPPIYPREPFARARVRAMVEVVASGIQPLQNLLVLERVSGDPEARKTWGSYFNAKGLAAIAKLVDAASPSGPFCFGPSLTAADLVLVPQMYSARRFGVDVDAWPRLVGAEKATLALPGMMEATPERQGDAVP
jgi:maleylacetoacetate isomerase